MKKWLKQNSVMLTTITSIIGIVIAGVGLWFVYAQLEQANTLKKWENYNVMNERYHKWYMSTPDIADSYKCEPFENVEENTKRWVRSYFHLYSEEYWLFQNDLIPEDMWTKRIDGGVDINLENYPILISGYEYWKSKGSFSHPIDFTILVDKKINSIKEKSSCDVGHKEIKNVSK